MSRSSADMAVQPSNSGEVPLRRRDLHSGRRAQRRRRRRRRLILLVSFLLVMGTAVTAGSFLWPSVRSLVGAGTSDDYPGPGTGSVQVTIPSGATGADIATLLNDAGVVRTRGAYLQAAAADPTVAAKIQAGTYTLKKEMSGKGAFELLTDPKAAQAGKVTIREGLWKSETFEVLSKASGIPVADYEAAAKDPDALGLPSEAKGNVEGWLFPSTYNFGPDASAADQLETMIKESVRVLDELQVSKADREHILTLASIVETEAKLDVDRPKIARVFVNRVQDPTGPTLGRLQSDATVSYGVGKRELFPTQKQLDDKSNKYNTRVHKGWPPGPISNPGKASIEAALNPAPGPWFYFVAVNPDTGETKYATTLSQHNKNIEELTAYCAAHPKSCS